MSTDLASLVVNLDANIAKYSTGLNQARKQLSDFTDSVKDGLGDLAGALGLYFSVDSVVEWGKALVEQDANLDHFSQETGVAVEQLSALQFALESGGVGADKLGVIFRDLQKNISEAAGNGSSNAAVAFKLLGVSVTDAAGNLKDSQTIISEVADKFSNLEDGANKTALAVQLFGRAGEQMIPTLDKGAAGIAALEQQAGLLGATISDKTAKAAEQFEQDVNNLGTAVKEGLGQRIIADLLPALDGLTKSFQTTNAQGQQFDTLASGIADGIKVLGAGALYAINSVIDLGKGIGGLAAAGVALAHGNFSQAGSVLKDMWADLGATDKAFADKEKALWADASKSVTDSVAVVKAQAPNLAGGEAAQKAFDDAIKKLTEFDNSLKQQIVAVGGAKDATIEYRLAHGDLAAAIAVTGAKGAQLAADITASGHALQTALDSKTITTGLGEVQAALDKLAGNTGAGGVEAVENKYKDLVTAATRAGGAQGDAALKAYDALVVATGQQDLYNEDLKQEQEIEKSLTDTLAKLNDARENGAMTQADYDKQAADARTAAASQLQGVAADMKSISDANPANGAMKTGLDDITAKVSTLGTQAKAAGNQLRQSFETDGADALLEFEQGTKSASAAFGDFLNNIATGLLKLANQQLVQSLFGQLGGIGGGGSQGNWFQSLAGLFGNTAGATAGAGAATTASIASGAESGLDKALSGFGGGMAAGGSVNAGSAYRVNEQDSNSEWFIPNVSGQVVPASKLSGTTVHQTFLLQAPQGTVSRATQLQTGAAAAKGLNEANRRNN